MSIWTFRPRVLLLAAVTSLAGCLQTTSDKPRDIGLTRSAPQTVAVARNSVVIGGPAGYCVDRKSSRLAGDTAFVLLGGCASISRNANAGSPVFPAILTASVTKKSETEAAVETELDQMAQVLVSARGRATLARDGRADSVDILDTRREGGAVFILLRDNSPNPTPGLQTNYWRGLSDLNGRLISLSVVGFASQPLSRDAGLGILRGFLDRIRSETAILTEPPPAKVAPTPRRQLFPAQFN